MSCSAIFRNIKCRNSLYARSSVNRFPVPDEFVAWSVEFAEYKPEFYESEVLKGKPWADPNITGEYTDLPTHPSHIVEGVSGCATRFSSLCRALDKLNANVLLLDSLLPYFNRSSTILFVLGDNSISPKWNQLDGKVNRESHCGKYRIVENYPQNPCGRTGIIGRGLLGRWGPNHAADPIVTRWKRDRSGTILTDESSGR